MTGSEFAKKSCMFVLKFGVAVAIISWLVYLNFDNLKHAFATFNYWYLAPALLVYLLHMVVSAWRWYVLAKYLGFRLRFFQSLSLTMQGYFFSLVIPGGAIGGDVARIGFLARRSPEGTRFEGAVTVLMDRIVGMVALFVLTIVLMLWSLPILLQVEVEGAEWLTHLRIWGVIALFCLCVGGNMAMLALFFHRHVEKIPPFGTLMGAGDRWSKGCVSQLTGALDTYRSRWRGLVMLTVASIFGVHLMTVAAVWVITLGLPEGAVDLLTLAVAVSVGNIAGLIPLSLSGIGIRDVTIEAILGAGMVKMAAAIPLLYTMIILLGNLIGGIFFVLDPGRKAAKEVE